MFFCTSTCAKLRRCPSLCNVTTARPGVIPQWTVGDRLRKARELTGLDRKAFAAEIGASRNSIATYESSDRPPRRFILLAWAAKTGVSIDWLLGDDDTPWRDAQPPGSSDSGTTNPCYSLATESSRGGRLAYVLCHTRAA